MLPVGYIHVEIKHLLHVRKNPEEGTAAIRITEMPDSLCLPFLP